MGTLATELTDPLLDSTQSAWGRMLATLQTLVNESDSPAALQQAILDAYGGLDSAELVRLMSAAMALAELKGMADTQMTVRHDGQQLRQGRGHECACGFQHPVPGAD